jgi:UPF0755 protein
MWAKLRQRWLLLSLAVLVLLSCVVAGRYWLFQQHLQTPLSLNAPYVLTIAKGSNFTRVVNQLQQDYILNNRDLLYYVRFHKLASRIQAGEYALEPGMTPLSFLQQLIDGKVIEYQVRIGEGWTFTEALTAIQAHAAITTTLAATDTAGWQQALGTAQYPEGWLLPETYNFTRGTTDVELAQRAKAMMEQHLQQLWQARDSNLPYATAYEALIMASIIEKETGQSSERPAISGVFVRRLQQQMKLQTDPTVIYGVGPSFDGNLTRAHLQTDTPYNSYTRAGLPPTPIALPSLAALQASVHPEPGSALYFVAKGDGTHYFSSTLEEHNAAVRQYQLGQ